MNKWIVIPIITILVAGLAVTGFAYVSKASQLDDTKNQLDETENQLVRTMGELDTTKTQLAVTETLLNTSEAQLVNTEAQLDITIEELDSTKETLVSTQTELDSTKETLVSTQTELDSTKTTLASTRTELGSTKTTLASTRTALDSAQQTIESTQKQLAVAQETLGGLGITLSTTEEWWDVVLIDNPAATNPTWSELKAFLTEDQTENHTYIVNEYDCSQYSGDIHNNAEAAGIRTAEVYIQFESAESTHAANAFLTSDYGLVYVDSTKRPDKIARIQVGEEYRAVELSWITRINIRNDYWWDTLSSYYYIASGTGRNAKTSSIEIFW